MIFLIFGTVKIKNPRAVGKNRRILDRNIVVRVNQIVEDMLRMYVMNNPTKWEDYPHLAEFAYKNGYEASAKMSLFEVLYGWMCRTSVTWDSLVDRLMLGPDLLMDLEQLVTKVHVNLKE